MHGQPHIRLKNNSLPWRNKMCMKRQYVGTELEGLEKKKKKRKHGKSSCDIRRLVILGIVTARNIETKTP